MQIGAQTFGLARFERTLIAREHAKKKAKKNLMAGLTLTAMVDMFSVLVIFLLQTFSASPELLVTKGVSLPVAASGAELQDAPVLSIAADGVYLDQKLVGTTDEILKNPEPLMTRLEALREQWQRANPDQSFKGEVVFQADKLIPSTTVSQIMALLPGQAYSTIQLAVIGGGSGK